MGQGFLSGFLQSGSQAFGQAQAFKVQRGFQKEQLDLAKKKFDLEEKESELKRRQIEQAIQSGELFRSLAQSIMGPQEQTQQPTGPPLSMPSQGTGLDLGQGPVSGLRGAMTGTPGPSQAPQGPQPQGEDLMRVLLGLSFMKGDVGDILATGERAGVIPPKPEKEPAPTLDRAIQSEIDRLGLTGEDALAFRINKYAQITGAKAAAAQEEKPIPAEQISAVSQLEVLDKMAQETANLFKEDYVGKVDVVKGFFREYTGNITDEEIRFRKNTLDMQDALLRARSGAQINEQEYQRLRRFLPKLSDQGNVYRAALKRFNEEVTALKEEKLKLAKTPRGKLGNVPSTKGGKPQGNSGKSTNLKQKYGLE